VDVEKKSNVFAKFWADVKEQPLLGGGTWVGKSTMRRFAESYKESVKNPV
jgi:hypothetical protein